MIGQDMLKEIVDVWSVSNMPRSILLTGTRGSGRRTFCRYVGEKMGMEIRWLGNKVDDVRDMIVDSQQISRTTLYVFQDADDMSAAAKNSLLKVTEEPPRFANIVMILEDSSKMLRTIESRSIEVAMAPYTDIDLTSFLTTDDPDVMLSIARTPGEIEEARKVGVDKLVEYVETVINNIMDVTFMNCMKIQKSMKFKEDDEGFPVVLFLRTFLVMLAKKFVEVSDKITMAESKEYQRRILVTQSMLTVMANRSISKKLALDMWIVRIREEVK